MPVGSKSLDAKAVAAAKPRETVYRLSDGGGLLLEVKPSGAKSWQVRVTVQGRRRDVGLGGYPAVSLAAAREKARAVRRQAVAGDDPVADRKAAAEARKAAAVAVLREAEERKSRTFGAVAGACIVAQSPGWKNARTAALWRKSLADHAAPLLAMPVADIGRAEVLASVEAVWVSRPATGKKVLRRIGSVLRYAAAHGMRANDNPADVRMLRHAGLPALPGGRKQPSLPWSRMPAFTAALAWMPGVAPLALRFAILTALRSTEVRHARWSWLSFDSVPVLIVPGEAMKSKRSAAQVAHRVPLASAAVEVLAAVLSALLGKLVPAAEVPRRAALLRDGLIFPNASLSGPLSDMALSAVIRRMNEARPEGAPLPWRDPDGRGAVPHGFRATFSTWVDDTRPEEREAAEKALAHEVANAVSAAYRRSDLFDRRIPLMEAWAAHSCPASVAASGEGPLPGQAMVGQGRR